MRDPVKQARKAELGSIVKVVWSDAFTINSGWADGEEVQELIAAEAHEGLTVVSAGIFMGVNSKHLAVVQSSTVDGSVGDLLIVPVGWLIEFKVLEPA